MKSFEILAMAGSTPAGTEANPQGQMLQMVGMFAIMGAMFYFLMIRPQQKQRKQHEAMLNNLKTGDKIITTGGLFGIVSNVKDKSVMVKIADNVKVEIARSAVTAVVSGETAGNQ
jgi:preprotein translocase subunit YajC